MRIAVHFSLFFFLLLSITLQIDSAQAAEFTISKGKFGFLVGYGQSFPGWGQTTQQVETIDLVPRYNHIIFDELGYRWFKGYHSILLEAPIHIVMSPKVSSMIGVNFLACYTFTSIATMRPYLFGGGGPVYSFGEISGMGADLNGNYQIGIGLEYPMPQNYNLLFEFRYHHISNGGREKPNEPLNSCKFLVGMTF